VRNFKSISYGRLLEQIEIVRSGLRWSTSLDRAAVSRLLHQVNKLRNEVLTHARVERIKARKSEKQIKEHLAGRERRQALLDRSFVFEGVFGDNPKLLETLETVEKAARTDLPILIEGESGTGKELLAKVIHGNSIRSQKPFISVNCGAITSTLLESELFGHVKGAFTGSIKDRKGLFEAADGGTIFLDEVGELPLESQVKLLRALQSGEIQRVGSDDPIQVDTRIVAATNRDLYDMSVNRQFREDLYYRISTIAVTIPPLHERKDEIPLLIDYFSTEAANQLKQSEVKLTPRLYDFLHNYAYRGNIRELRNIIYRVACISDGTADIEHLPEHIRPARAMGVNTLKPNSTGNGRTLESVRKSAVNAAEKTFIEEQLRLVNGNVTKLARQLDMNRSYLQTLLKKRGIRAKEFKQQKQPAVTTTK
jgi:transcriptional regulator with GAF, ATPase, and Fis domain